MSHAIGKQSSILLAAKVEAPDLPGIPPLMEIGCSLVIFEASGDWTVYYHLKKGEEWYSVIWQMSCTFVGTEE